MTITIDRATLVRIRKIAGSRGVSKFIADAARERAGRNELLEYLDDLDAKHGRPSPEMLAEIDRDMREIFGMPPPTRPWDPYAQGDRKPHRGQEAKALARSSSRRRKRR